MGEANFRRLIASAMRYFRGASGPEEVHLQAARRRVAVSHVVGRRIASVLSTFVLYRRSRAALYRFSNRRQPRWVCPICGYLGPLMPVQLNDAVREHAQCPSCGALERHRLQELVVREVFARLETSRLSIAHFAAERFFRDRFSRRFRQYVTVDLQSRDADLNADLCRLPFRDQSFDVVYASHVLEHVRDDAQAISEIWRVLRPGGVAILPVPLVAETTIEYPAANPHEVFHWRAPGPDYFDRYREQFSRVEEFGSEAFPAEYQLFTYEDRTGWPTAEMPLRRPMKGEKHRDIVPVCYR